MCIAVHDCSCPGSGSVKGIDLLIFLKQVLLTGCS